MRDNLEALPLGLGDGEERREEVRNGSQVSNLAVVVSYIDSGNVLLKLAGKGHSWVPAWKIPMRKLSQEMLSRWE